MLTSSVAATLLALSGVVTTGASVAQAVQQQTPEHQVIAIYFHRTVRCPTCKRIGAMAEEAVDKGFEEELRSHAVKFLLVDFQDKKNAKLSEACGVESPTLVLLNVFEGEVVCGANMPGVWQLVGKPDDFRAYVQEGVVRYLKQSKEDAEKEREKSKESKE